jgi:lipopolysaccharide transport system ATP-binding protein
MHQIEVCNLSKFYKIRKFETQGYQTLRDVISENAKKVWNYISDQNKSENISSTSKTFKALDDISFTINKGESVGFIGLNGAGKSTLLKILSRITEPSKGKAIIRGRVTSLLEVGTGFHPELTGKENIYLNGAILGMSRNEINKRFDEIVEFSEVSAFLDTPVKRFSSGMQVRLAFSVAAHLNSEILIIDEVLAVGDMKFQKRCINKIAEVTHEGRTILFVSHNMGAISELCDRAILLDKGKLIADDTTSNLIKKYLHLNTENSKKHHQFLEIDAQLPCNITEIKISNEHDEYNGCFDISEPIVIKVKYLVSKHCNNLQLTITLTRNGVELFHTFDTDNLKEIPVSAPGEYIAICTLPGMFLKSGQYLGCIAIGTTEKLIQSIPSAFSFEIEELSLNTTMKGYRHDRPGHIIAPCEWTTQSTGA